MYLLYDLAFCYGGWLGTGMHSIKMTENPKKFESKDDLLQFWRKYIGTDFMNLNVTGNDTWCTHVLDGCGFAKKEIYVRRFVVTDEHGAHQDIRLWQEPQEQPAKPWRCWHHSGRKRKWHRAHGPSMLRRMRKAAENEIIETDGMDIIAPKARHKAVIWSPDCWDYYDRHHARSSKSWKSNKNAWAQYAKHKKKGYGEPDRKRRDDPDIWERLAADGFPISPCMINRKEGCAWK